MFEKKVIIEFKKEKTNLRQYTNTEAFKEFKKFVHNFMIEEYLNGNKIEGDTMKKLLQNLYLLETKKRLDK